MSTTRLIVPFSFRACHRQAFLLNPCRLSAISKPKDGCRRFLGNRDLQSLSTGRRVQSHNNTTIRGMAIYSSVQPGAPLPSNPSPSSWKNWILGMLLTLILPSWKFGWGSLQALKNKVDTAVETAEHIADAVEKVAEEVEKVAEEVADHLPEGGKFKDAVTFVENLAKETAKDAQLIGDVIDKVEDVEKDVESFLEPVIDDQANEIAKAANDQK